MPYSVNKSSGDSQMEKHVITKTVREYLDNNPEDEKQGSGRDAQTTRLEGETSGEFSTVKDFSGGGFARKSGQVGYYFCNIPKDVRVSRFKELVRATGANLVFVRWKAYKNSAIVVATGSQEELKERFDGFKINGSEVLVTQLVHRENQKNNENVEVLEKQNVSMQTTKNEKRKTKNHKSKVEAAESPLDCPTLSAKKRTHRRLNNPKLKNIAEDKKGLFVGQIPRKTTKTRFVELIEEKTEKPFYVHWHAQKRFAFVFWETDSDEMSLLTRLKGLKIDDTLLNIEIYNRNYKATSIENVDIGKENSNNENEEMHSVKDSFDNLDKLPNFDDVRSVTSFSKDVRTYGFESGDQKESTYSQIQVEVAVSNNGEDADVGTEGKTETGSGEVEEKSTSSLPVPSNQIHMPSYCDKIRDLKEGCTASPVPDCVGGETALVGGAVSGAVRAAVAGFTAAGTAQADIQLPALIQKPREDLKTLESVEFSTDEKSKKQSKAMISETAVNNAHDARSEEIIKKETCPRTPNKDKSSANSYRESNKNSEKSSKAILDSTSAKDKKSTLKVSPHTENNVRSGKSNGLTAETSQKKESPKKNESQKKKVSQGKNGSPQKKDSPQKTVSLQKTVSPQKNKDKGHKSEKTPLAKEEPKEKENCVIS